MPSSTRLKVTPHDAAAVIGVCCIGLFAIYILANVVAHVWVYGFISENDLISSLVLHRLK